MLPAAGPAARVAVDVIGAAAGAEVCTRERLAVGAAAAIGSACDAAACESARRLCGSAWSSQSPPVPLECPASASAGSQRRPGIVCTSGGLRHASALRPWAECLAFADTPVSKIAQQSFSPAALNMFLCRSQHRCHCTKRQQDCSTRPTNVSTSTTDQEQPILGSPNEQQSRSHQMGSSTCAGVRRYVRACTAQDVRKECARRPRREAKPSTHRAFHRAQHVHAP